MRILVTGATGLLGTQLVGTLVQQGFEITVVSRDVQKSAKHFSVPVKAVAWNAPYDPLPPEALEGVSGIINLMGENIAGRRWTAEQKKRILDSRAVGTRQIAEALHLAGTKVGFFIGASAVGFYGDRGDEVITEESKRGEGFLSDVCRDWEIASHEVPAARSVIFRLGVVLSREGGFLAKMLPLFKAGMAGPVGGGDQWIPWIHEEDLVSLVVKTVFDEKKAGTFNAASEHPVTNREFGETLAGILHRPFVVPTPAFALKLAMGEMASIALDSTRVIGKPEITKDFTFKTLRAALEDLLAEK